MKTALPLPLRLPLVFVLLAALLTAIWAGLIRLGWTWPAWRPAAHGPLMVSGFLGTLVALERAVALGERRFLVGPALSALGALALLAGASGSLGPLLFTFGSLGLVVTAAVITRRHPAPHTLTIALGAAAWAVGNALWLAGRPVAEAAPWWGGFLVLTIAGERLELSRVLRLTRGERQRFGAAAAVYGLGLLVSLADFVIGLRLAGLGLVLLAGWLGRHDIARRTVGRPGLTRYIAANLLVGYVWLAAAGVLGLAHTGATAGLYYDAWLHSLFLGFVFSMIFAHALIILPAVTGLPIAFHPVLYGPALLMHLGLAARVAGDLLTGEGVAWTAARRWGGLANGLAILWFISLVALLAVRARRTTVSQAVSLQKPG